MIMIAEINNDDINNYDNNTNNNETDDKQIVITNLFVAIRIE
jgi:hypothetical protein